MYLVDIIGGEIMEMTYCKTAERNKNRIIIPKWYIEKFGRQFYMIIKDNGEMIIRPINKKGE